MTKTKKNRLDLPSSNHLPLIVKDEIKSLTKVCFNYLDMYEPEDVRYIFQRMANLEWGKADTKDIADYVYPNSHFPIENSRFQGVLNELNDYHRQQLKRHIYSKV